MNPGGWVLLKRGAGAKSGAPCCAVNHSLCFLGAVDRCPARADRSHTALWGRRYNSVSQGVFWQSHHHACYSGF